MLKNIINTLLIVIGMVAAILLTLGWGNEFILVLFICPFIVLIATIIGNLLLKKWFIMPLITFSIFFVMMYVIFNESFFIWVISYTIISLLVSLTMNVLK
ncbi:DUF2651 family protein [Calidifontibacillus oryziterrae]|uniref:DUF2651 family protein n=1 Tax=Calidifontibacillus oryziterrae TaxID=1191699 RepID=UPI000319F583|nr:DUF2651 family protein [Calidifontibacillus oryziterrae]